MSITTQAVPVSSASTSVTPAVETVMRPSSFENVDDLRYSRGVLDIVTEGIVGSVQLETASAVHGVR
jgi:hypothetical protein